MKKVIFKDNKLQKGYRVKIPKAVIDTLELKEGDEVIIFYDPIKKEVSLKFKNE